MICVEKNKQNYAGTKDWLLNKANLNYLNLPNVNTNKVILNGSEGWYSA